jgi:hypothetical protein
MRFVVKVVKFMSIYSGSTIRLHAAVYSTMFSPPAPGKTALFLLQLRGQWGLAKW